MSTGGFDFGPMLAKMKEHQERQIKSALQAVDQFGEVVLANAAELAPHGGGSHSPYDQHAGYLQKDAPTALPAKLEGTKIEKTIGFNAEYAAVQHEDLDFGHDIGQAKYLETAMRRMQDKLAPFIASKMKEGE